VTVWMGSTMPVTTLDDILQEYTLTRCYASGTLKAVETTATSSRELNDKVALWQGASL
jgi:hypothetical protein